ncbi:hypothetical protein D9M68_1004740 [compost metagenome]
MPKDGIWGDPFFVTEDLVMTEKEYDEAVAGAAVQLVFYCLWILAALIVAGAGLLLLVLP